MSADTTPGLALRDAEALISQYCYETTDYGDTSVFKTKRLLDMVRRAFEMGRTAQAASGEPAAEEHEQAPAYRLLERSDRIAQDDEFLDDDATTWAKDAGGLFVGMLYAPGALRPGRRVIKP